MTAPVTEQEWRDHKNATSSAHMSPHPDVFLGYQKDLFAATAENQVVVVEKSRRIGATWGIGAEAVLTAASEKKAGGQDVLYIGYNLDMTREFIDCCANWAKAFSRAASEVSEFLFKEQDERGVERAIQAFRIRFLSGFEIVALCSRPRSLRGRQGYVILDEFAFHDEPSELLKAAFALLIWGGKVLVISTHDGADNPFNELIQECRAGKRPYKVLRITFDDALRDGLYRRVCLVRGIEWTAEGEAQWRDQIVGIYADAADEELHCIPRAGGGKYFSRVLLEARSTDAPVVRWTCDDKFVDVGDDTRARECSDWCNQVLAPLLASVGAAAHSFLGEDFGRTGDLSSMWPLLLEQDLSRRTPFVVELRNVPFREQEQILYFICDRLPSFAGAALDARGNGQYLAERARQRYGPTSTAEVMLSEGWYREHMPRLKGALEDNKFSLPANADIHDDFRTIEVVRGVPRVVERTGKAGEKRHGDTCIAAALAMFASETLEATDFGYLSGDAPAAAEVHEESTFHDAGNTIEGWQL